MGKRRETTKKTRLGLYAAAQYLSLGVEKELGLQIPFDVYQQDPLVAEEDMRFGFDDEFYVRWEPGLADGRASGRRGRWCRRRGGNAQGCAAARPRGCRSD